MTATNLAALVLVILLMGYLTYALLRPDRF